MDTIKIHNAAIATAALPEAGDKQLARAGVLCEDCGVEMVRPRHKPVVNGKPRRVEVRCLCCNKSNFKLVDDAEVAAIAEADKSLEG